LEPAQRQERSAPPPAGDIVVLAVPYAVVFGVVKQYGDKLAGKLLIDITNPVDSSLTGFVTPTNSFGAQEVVKAAPAVAQGDRVLVIGRATGRVKATNKPFVDDWVFAITVRNGKLTNIREYVDTQALARASEMDASP
jgi:hypothetical protein